MMQYQSVLAVDVGSTTTKAIFLDRSSGEFRLRYRAEAPTTVERPLEDVMIGVHNALERLQNISGRQLLRDGQLITPAEGEAGVDIFMATSSAGGGLQMVVGGIWHTMTSESAKRAALGAGAIVMDTFSADDNRTPVEKIQRIQELRPDMILLSGGIDGGNISHVTQLAEIVALARPQPRLGKSYTLPVVYAGNIKARNVVDTFLEDICLVKHVDNLRPTLEDEVLQPAREQISELFMEHVMSHAPGYSELLDWSQDVILPTPGSVGRVINILGEEYDMDVLAVDVGGATTDVFSSVFMDYRKFIPGKTSPHEATWENVQERAFHRSVSANLGMSYSIGNILYEAGAENVMRWLPFTVDEGRLRDWCSNKMIRPTTLPQSLWALMLEQAFAREAMRLALERHFEMARSLRGISVKRDVGDIFRQGNTGWRLFEMEQIDAIVGSGGVLSHAPRRTQALSMLLDSLQPAGITELYVDSIFMMPQLGILSTVARDAALEVLVKDGLVNLGTCIAPIGTPRLSSTVATVDFDLPGGRKQHRVLRGKLSLVPLPQNERVTITVRPASGVDVGAGVGKIVQGTAIGGPLGVILDGRNRPIEFPKNEAERVVTLRDWYQTLQVYPDWKEEK